MALEIAEDNKFFPKQSKAISEEYQYFLSSLVCNVRYVVPELKYCILLTIYYTINGIVHSSKVSCVNSLYLTKMIIDSQNSFFLSDIL